MTRVAKAPCHLSEEENKPTLYIYISYYIKLTCVMRTALHVSQEEGAFFDRSAFSIKF